MGQFILFVLQSLIALLIWAIIINVIMSWLVAFDVINLRHPVVRQFARFLDAVTAPVLAPFRRIIPLIGGMDISPIFTLIVLQGISGYLLPWMFAKLYPIIG